MKPCKPYIFLVAAVLFICNCRRRNNDKPVIYEGKPPVPSTILQQHDSLIMTITKWTTFGDSTARSAYRLKEIMVHHFREEEDYVLPALGVLPSIVNGIMPAEPKELTRMIDQYKANSSHFIAEHQMIKVYMEELKAIAGKENHHGLAEFEKALTMHVREEEELLFPAVILIGEYLKLLDRGSN